MEGYSRDLLCGIGGGGDGPRRGEQRPRLDMETEEVELTLGLSLGGRFGLERSGGERLARSSSVASSLAPEEVALAPPALARTSSLPTMADVEAEKKQMLGDWSGFRGNGFEVEPTARPPVSGSGSPSSGSSDGEGKRLEGWKAWHLVQATILCKTSWAKVHWSTMCRAVYGGVFTEGAPFVDWELKLVPGEDLLYEKPCR